MGVESLTVAQIAHFRRRRARKKQDWEIFLERTDSQFVCAPVWISREMMTWSVACIIVASQREAEARTPTGA